MKQEKDKKAHGLGWLKKKTQHALVGGEKVKKEDKKSSFLGKYRITRKTSKESLTAPSSPPSSPELSGDDSDEAVEDDVNVTKHRERLTQLRLQQQIQLLRNLHSQQQTRPTTEGGMYATMEFASAPSAPLAKSVSMPSIMRGMSVAHFNRS